MSQSGYDAVLREEHTLTVVLTKDNPTVSFTNGAAVLRLVLE